MSIVSWKIRVKEWDPDSIRMLEISAAFLVRYFGHDPHVADRLVDEFLARSIYDEDFIHHEGAYRTAAIIHFLESLGGAPSTVGNWLVEKGYNKTPAEALEYFREHYFQYPSRTTE